MLSSQAQHQHDHTYQKVEIDLRQHSLRDLARAGVDVTHGTYLKNHSFSAVFGDWELAELTRLGFSFEILVPDMQSFYKERNTTRGSQCAVEECFQKSYNYEQPQNFELGSMGGFFTYNQMLDHLDAMSFIYPNLITIRRPIGDFRTHQGNEIFWIKISDNPDFDEQEPEVLYTALHHAREPMSLSQMIYYMWYLLEQYESNPEVQDIINETELFFIPCLNPDGYIWNNENHPQGGGMWRKNGRDNDGNGIFDITEDGVDINRNYGFQWGFDNDGSSSNTRSETYRGESPFSEPETQAIQAFCSEREFQLALNYHSYGNVLLYPFGYDPDATPEDQLLYDKFGEALTQENDYLHGTSYTALDYVTNGDANDWMYGDDVTKTSILTFTPEVGSSCDDFYPDLDNIIPLCEQTLAMNLQLTKLVHGYGWVRETGSSIARSKSEPLELMMSNYGQETISYDVSVTARSANILNVESDVQVELISFASESIEFQYNLSEDIEVGEEVLFEIRTSNGKTIELDTIVKIYMPDQNLIVHNGDETSGWIQAGDQPWGKTNDAYIGPFAYTDSPNGNYAKNLSKTFMLSDEIDLTKADAASVEFWAKWEIDEFFDYTAFQVSVEGGDWQNLCGEHTTVGSIFQDEDEPIYDGIQEDWVRENISLDPYIGQNIRLRFVLFTDGFNELDGFYFDEFVISIDQEVQTVSTNDPYLDVVKFDLAHPNPTDHTVHIPLTMTEQVRDAKIVLMDVMGRKLIEQEISSKPGRQLVQLDVSHLAAGLYYYGFGVENQVYLPQNLIVE